MSAKLNSDPDHDDEIAFDLMSALYSKKRSRLLKIRVDLNGMSATESTMVLKCVSFDHEGTIAIGSLAGQTLRCLHGVKDALLIEFYFSL